MHPPTPEARAVVARCVDEARANLAAGLAREEDLLELADRPVDAGRHAGELTAARFAELHAEATAAAGDELDLLGGLERLRRG